MPRLVLHRVRIRASQLLPPAGFLVMAALCISVGQASDIPGDVTPPSCQYDANGIALRNFPQSCNGPFSIASILGDSLDTAMLTRDPGISLWQLSSTIHGSEMILQFHNTFGSFQPVPNNALIRGNPTGSGHVLARLFSVTISNAGQQPWSGFYFELQSTLGQPSDEDDSISFGEGDRVVGRVPTSMPFQLLSRESVVRDSLTFGRGLVFPGEASSFNFLISEDQTDDFFLIERPLTIPEPTTMSLCVTGLVVLFVIRNRRRRLGRL